MLYKTRLRLRLRLREELRRKRGWQMGEKELVNQDKPQTVIEEREAHVFSHDVERLRRGRYV